MKVLAVLAIVLGLTISLIPMAASQDESLMLFLSFEKVEGKKVIDESGRGNDAQIVENPKQIPGKFGMAMEFDGASDYLTIPDNEALNPEQITVMSWAKPGVIAACHRVFSKDDGGNRDYELSFCDGTLEFAAWNQGGNRAIPNGPGVKANVWSHQAATFDGKEVKVYLDGVAVGLLPLDGKLQNTDVELIIGRFTEGLELYSGLLDDLALFNRAFTKDEIKEVMTKGVAKLFMPVKPKEKLATTWSRIKAAF
jgi:hypothetical protein